MFKFILGDVTDMSKTETILSYAVGVLVAEMVIIFLVRLTNTAFAAKAINRWYDTFRLDAFLMDSGILMIGFFLASWTYPMLFKEWNPLYYMLLILGIQITHDLLFYFFAILGTPKGHNLVMDLMRHYAGSVSYNAILGDSFMYLVAAPVAMLLVGNKFTTPSLLISAVFTMYPILYMLYTVPVKTSARPDPSVVVVRKRLRDDVM
jgi:hypothetical protein